MTGEDGGGFGDEKNRKLGDELEITLPVCVVWAQSRENSGGSSNCVPMAHIGWCWFTVGSGEYTFKGQNRIFFFRL